MFLYLNNRKLNEPENIVNYQGLYRIYLRNSVAKLNCEIYLGSTNILFKKFNNIAIFHTFSENPRMKFVGSERGDELQSTHFRVLAH